MSCLPGLDLKSIEDPNQREARRRIGYVERSEDTPASVVTINSVIAGIAGDMLVKYLTGFAAAPTFVAYDALEHAMQALRLSAAPDCPICGKAGIEGLGVEREAPLPSPKGSTELFAGQAELVANGGGVAIPAGSPLP